MPCNNSSKLEIARDDFYRICALLLRLGLYYCVAKLLISFYGKRKGKLIYRRLRELLGQYSLLDYSHIIFTVLLATVLISVTVFLSYGVDLQINNTLNFIFLLVTLTITVSCYATLLEFASRNPIPLRWLIITCMIVLAIEVVSNFLSPIIRLYIALSLLPSLSIVLIVEHRSRILTSKEIEIAQEIYKLYLQENINKLRNSLNKHKKEIATVCPEITELT